MGRQYIEEARGRLALVHLAVERGMWAATVREAQECVELFLKGALRLVAVEPARTHDVAAALRAEAARFPESFRSSIDTLAAISTTLAGDRGPAFYGDEDRELGPRDLFDEADARRAVQDAELVAEACTRLLSALERI
jgi:HEPN domain-containing protein